MSKTDPSVQTVITAGEIAARVVADATETAKGVVEKATNVAADLATKTHEEHKQTTKALEEALRNVFGEHEDAQRFVDVTKIPLLCKSVIDINLRLLGIETQLKPIFWGVGIIAGAVILAIVGALFTLILK